VPPASVVDAALDRLQQHYGTPALEPVDILDTLAGQCRAHVILPRQVALDGLSSIEAGVRQVRGWELELIDAVRRLQVPWIEIGIAMGFPAASAKTGAQARQRTGRLDQRLRR
jgi:hypothetical protein